MLSRGRVLSVEYIGARKGEFWAGRTAGGKIKNRKYRHQTLNCQSQGDSSERFQGGQGSSSRPPLGSGGPSP